MFSVIFPGQGSQSVAMGKNLYDKYDFVKKLFIRADDILGYSISEIILEGPKETLDNTENTSITDLFDYDESDDIKYIISVNYENNPYWGWANSEPVYPFSDCVDLGDLNGDGGWNVLDIVGLANCVLASNCSDL